LRLLRISLLFPLFDFFLCRCPIPTVCFFANPTGSFSLSPHLSFFFPVNDHSCRHSLSPTLFGVLGYPFSAPDFGSSSAGCSTRGYCFAAVSRCFRSESLGSPPLRNFKRLFPASIFCNVWTFSGKALTSNQDFFQSGRMCVSLFLGALFPFISPPFPPPCNLCILVFF